MKKLVGAFSKYWASQPEENQLLLKYKIALSFIVLVCSCVFLYEVADSDQRRPPHISTVTKKKEVEVTYLGLAGESLVKEDAELILKAHLLYKQGSHSLLDGIKRGCRVTKSRYKNYSSTTLKTTAIYNKLKPICEEYSIYL